MRKRGKGPKKPMTAFLLFSNAMRAAVKAESPGIEFGEVSKILGEKWARICAKEKAEYEAKAAEDKDRYLREMQEYARTKSDSESEARSPSGKKHKASAAQAYAQEWPAVESARLGGNERKASGAPKKPMTPFLHFSNAVRMSVKAESPGIAFGELAKVIGEKWAKLSAQEKAEYVKRSDEDKQRYAREMQDYALAREGAAGSGSAAADAPIRVEEETTEEEEETDEEEEEEEEEEDEEVEQEEDEEEAQDEEGKQEQRRR